MAAESPNSGDYFYLGLTLRKNLATCFGLMAAVCLLNIPGLFLTDFDRVFSVVRPVKRRFLQKKRMVRSSILFFYVIFFLFTGDGHKRCLMWYIYFIFSEKNEVFGYFLVELQWSSNVNYSIFVLLFFFSSFSAPDLDLSIISILYYASECPLSKNV